MVVNTGVTLQANQNFFLIYCCSFQGSFPIIHKRSDWVNTEKWLLAGEFSEFEYSRETRRFLKCARLARLADIRQAVLRGLARLADIRQVVLRRLARLADIRQAVLHGLARLAKGEFGEFYANLASLASLANLASVG